MTLEVAADWHWL